MNRKQFRRVAAFALLAVVALGSVACVTTVGVGVGGPVYGGYGGKAPSLLRCLRRGADVALGRTEAPGRQSASPRPSSIQARSSV